MLRDVKINNEVIKDVKFYTAVYQCKKCGSLSLRGETNQLRSWNTFIEWINPDQVRALVEERKQHEMDSRSDEKMPPA